MRVLVCLILALMLPLTPAWAQTEKTPQPGGLPIEIVNKDGALADLHEKYLAETGLQLERPVSEAPEPDEPVDRRRTDLPEWLANFLASLGPIMKLVFYAGCALVVATIAYFILTSVMGVRFAGFGDKKARNKDDVIADEDISQRPDAASARTLLEEADALASAGKYAEAVHLLLFRSIEDIQTRRGQRLSTALTAREIGQLNDLPSQRRAALNPIIAIVERSFFGGRAVDADGWQAARKSYQDFAFGEAWA